LLVELVGEGEAEPLGEGERETLGEAVAQNEGLWEGFSLLEGDGEAENAAESVGAEGVGMPLVLAETLGDLETLGLEVEDRLLLEQGEGEGVLVPLYVGVSNCVGVVVGTAEKVGVGTTERVTEFEMQPLVLGLFEEEMLALGEPETLGLRRATVTESMGEREGEAQGEGERESLGGALWVEVWEGQLDSVGVAVEDWEKEGEWEAVAQTLIAAEEVGAEIVGRRVKQAVELAQALVEGLEEGQREGEGEGESDTWVALGDREPLGQEVGEGETRGEAEEETEFRKALFVAALSGEREALEEYEGQGDEEGVRVGLTEPLVDTEAEVEKLGLLDDLTEGVGVADDVELLEKRTEVLGLVVLVLLREVAGDTLGEGESVEVFVFVLLELVEGVTLLHTLGEGEPERQADTDREVLRLGLGDAVGEGERLVVREPDDEREGHCVGVGACVGDVVAAGEELGLTTTVEEFVGSASVGLGEGEALGDLDALELEEGEREAVGL
jgi:hypothetical protein